MNRTETTHIPLPRLVHFGLFAGLILLLGLIITVHPTYAVPTALSISKTVDNATPTETDTVVWTITVSSTDTISPVLTDTLPAGLTLVSAFTNNAAEGTDLVQDGANLIWQPQLSLNGTLGPSPAVLIVTTTVDIGASDFDLITNTVTADSGESASAAISPQSASQLGIIKTVDNDNPEIFDIIEFNIILTDTVFSTPIITETLPEGLSLSSFTNNTIFRPTQTFGDDTIVWQPRVDSTLNSLSYPARLTVFAIVNRNAFDDFGPVITNTVITDGGLEASAAITVQDPGNQPSIKINKEVQELDPAFLRGIKSGDMISYTFTISNDGDFPLSNITIQDPAVPNITCDQEMPFSLGVSEIVVCTGEYRVTQDDIDALEVVNTATIFGVSDDITVSHEDTSVASLFAPPIEPDFTITQVVDNANPAPGDTVIFTIAVTDTVVSTPAIFFDMPDGFTFVRQQNNNINERSTRLENGAIWYPLINPNDEDVSFPAIMTVTATVDDDAASLGTVNTIVNTSEGDYILTEFVFDASVQIDVVASLAVTKTVLGTTAPSLDLITLDDQIVYEIEVANTGTVPLFDITVVDTLVPDIACQFGDATAINVGASFTCSLTHSVTQENVDNRRVDNTAVVTGMSASGEEASATADLTIEVRPTAISLNQIGGSTTSLLLVVFALLTVVIATVSVRLSRN